MVEAVDDVAYHCDDVSGDDADDGVGAVMPLPLPLPQAVAVDYCHCGHLHYRSDCGVACAFSSCDFGRASSSFPGPYWVADKDRRREI